MRYSGTRNVMANNRGNDLTERDKMILYGLLVALGAVVLIQVITMLSRK